MPIMNETQIYAHFRTLRFLETRNINEYSFLVTNKNVNK